nr:hypothetical protein [Actinomycetales bacterium]
MGNEVLALPVSLRGRVFTVEAAVAAGVKRGGLYRRSDVKQVARGLHAPLELEVNPGIIAGALCRQFPQAWVSHASAADLHGIELAEELHSPVPHLTVRTARDLVRRSGVECVVDPFLGVGVTSLSGVSVSAPERIWMELAAPISQRRAVRLGDHLVRVPREKFEGRSTPYVQVAQLHAAVAELSEAMEGPLPRTASMQEWERRRQVLCNLQAAVGLVRVGADSGPETDLRLAIGRAGLPEPELQIALMEDGRILSTADLGYSGRKIAIHYDGSPHLSADGHMRDMSRDNGFISAGWTNLRFGLRDYREGFRTAVGQIRAAIERRF